MDGVSAAPLTDLGTRLLANVDAGHSDYAESMLEVPAAEYLDRERFERELELVFRRSPLLVALSCDMPDPGAYVTDTIAGRPIVVIRGEDGTARTFANICRHRGAPVASECFGKARRLICPYHFWSYDTDGTLVAIPGEDGGFEGMDVSGLIELPTAERSGAIFAVLTPGTEFDVDEWLGEMANGLAMLKLDELHRHDVETKLPSGNWKATADGYLDGYHLGFLHRKSIGGKSITNRNTYDLWGPHVRIGFANKPILDVRDQPPAEWPDLYEAFSLVHYVYPNISISGHPDKSLMVSRLYPGPSVTESTVIQYQYFRAPLSGDAEKAEAEAKRVRYRDVTYEEDFLTVMAVTERAETLAAAGEVFRFGRNEMGNQNFHRTLARQLATES